LKNFLTVFLSNIYEILILATEILNTEITVGEVNILDYIYVYPNLIVRRLVQDEGSAVYIIEDKNSETKYQFAVRNLYFPPRIHSLMEKRVGILLFSFVLIGVMFLISAESYSDITVCCEQNSEGAICSPEKTFDSCNSDFLSSYTSCDSTSYCKLGTCYDTEEGICMGRTPKASCEAEGFIWDARDESQIPQCQLGCCLISNEVAFTTLARCRTISIDYGVPINYRSDISTELGCVALALGQDEGACVYESDYQIMCERKTRDECNAIGEVNYFDGQEETINPLEGIEKTFYKGCSLFFWKNWELFVHLRQIPVVIVAKFIGMILVVTGRMLLLLEIIGAVSL